MLTVADTVVPLAPRTSKGSVVLLGCTDGFEGSRLTEALAVLVVSTTLVAVIVTLWALLTVAGAVYAPFTNVPTLGLKDQVTAVLPVPVTEALNVVVAPAPIATKPGPTVTPTGCSDTVALAVFVESAALVAVTVTVCWLPITDGAW
jgi:hypothetical protein